MSKSGPKPNLPPPSGNQCGCRETVLWNEATQQFYRVDKPRWHSCEFIRLVNQYTMEAAAEAHAASVAKYPGKEHSEHRRIQYMTHFARLMGEARTKVLAYMESRERARRTSATEEQPKEEQLT